MRYDRIWATLVERAVRQGGIDAETFVTMAAEAGVDDAEIFRRLEDDLLNERRFRGFRF